MTCRVRHLRKVPSNIAKTYGFSKEAHALALEKLTGGCLSDMRTVRPVTGLPPSNPSKFPIEAPDC